MNIKIFSELHADDVTLDKSYYEDFKKKSSNSLYFEEEKINDLIFYAYQMSEEMEHSLTKQVLLNTLVDVLDFISIDELLELRHWEFKRLLCANSENYRLVYNEIIDGLESAFENE